NVQRTIAAVSDGDVERSAGIADDDGAEVIGESVGRKSDIGLGASTTECYANRATRIVNDGESGGTRTRLGGLEDDVHIERLSSVDGHWKRLREGELGCLRSRKGKRVDHQV